MAGKAAKTTAAVPASAMKAALAESLNELARKYPWRLFGLGDLAKMIGVNQHVISAAAARADGPFRGKFRKSRPETVVQWLMNPPPDFEFPNGSKEEEDGEV